jgi:cytochrome c5
VLTHHSEDSPLKQFALTLTAATLLALPPALSADPAAEGKTAYEAACARCHDTGIMGAPAVDDAAAWAEREAPGEAALEHHAEKGLLRGGVDDSARAAAEYMKSLITAE